MSDGPGNTGGDPWQRPTNLPPNVPPMPGPPNPSFLPPTPGPGAPAAMPPTVAAPPPPPGPPGSPAGSGAGGSGQPPSSFAATLAHEEGKRPLPAVASLIAAAGGVLAFLGLTMLLADPDIGGERITGVLLGMAFMAVGAAFVFVNRSQRSAAGGVALMALAAIPVVTYLFTSDSIEQFLDPTKYRNTQLSILVTLAAIWLACYVFGPTRRNGLFLGAALLAIWMVPMTYFSTTAASNALDSLSSFDVSSGFDTDFSDPSFDDPSFDDPTTDPFSEDAFSTDEPFGDDDGLSLKLGLTSLLFGGAYLAAGGKRDDDGDPRMATPFFAVAPLALFQAVTYLGEDLKVVGTSLLGLLIGAASIWLGVRGGRRFTSWIGVFWIVISLANLVGDNVDEAAPMGMILTVLGVLVIVGAMAIERMVDLPGPAEGIGDPPPGPGPAMGSGPGGPAAGQRAPMPEAWAPPASPSTYPPQPGATEGWGPGGTTPPS